MAGVKISGLHKRFGEGVHAVRGIDLDIPDRRFTVLVGPSGCGKSTLLRTIAGLEDADDGTIEIGGEVVNDMRPRDRDVAMVFQDYALYPHMTVRNNIGFGLKARKFPRAEIETRVRRAAEMLSITTLLDRLPRQLSGGQRQRVAIGRAIVRNPRLFLFDEPLSNLDAKLRDEMRGEIKRLHQEIATTMIYVTHDQIEAMTLADRIVLMRDGRIEQDGPPLELFERPATKFVAGFLGSPQMNFVAATLQRGPGGDALPLAAGELARVAVQEFGDAEEPGGAHDAGFDLGRREFSRAQTEADILGHRHMRIKRIVLEHHGHVAIARAHVVDHFAGDLDRAGVDILEAGDGAEQRALAAAGGADQHRELLVGKIEIDAAYGAHAARKMLVQAGDLHIRHCGYPLTAPSVSPRTRCRCTRIPSAIEGTSETMASALASP